MKFLQIFLLEIIIFTNLLAAQLETDSRPGSRSVYVVNENSGLIELYLRQCQCLNPATNSYCDCWLNFDDCDQPNIQGDSRIGLHIQIKYHSFFPGFYYHINEDSNPSIKVTEPQILIELLLRLGLDYLEQIGSKPASIDRYLQIISKGKLPVCAISNEQNKLAYHNYFHDLFNHVIFWISLPDEYRTFIHQRMQAFIDINKQLTENFKDNPIALKLIELLKFYWVAKFDTAMGTSNNKIIKFLSIGLSHEEMLHLRNDLENMVNFGLHLIGNQEDTYVWTIFDNKRFIAYWYKFYINFIKFDQFINSQDESLIDSINAIKKDKKTYQALLELKNLPVVTLTFKIGEVKQKAFELLKQTNLDQVKLEDRWFEVSNFRSQLDNNIQEIIERYKKLKAQSY